MRLEPEGVFPSLRAFVKAGDPVGDADYWKPSLRRAINFFYGAAAVDSVTIGGKGGHFWEWSIRLFGENDARWIQPHLPAIFEEIRTVRSASKFQGPEGLRVVGMDGYEAVHYADAGGESRHFQEIPNGTKCRLSIDGQTHEGTIRGGELKVGSQTFASFTSAFTDLVGRPGNAWNTWTLLLPNSSKWVLAAVARDQMTSNTNDGV